jgi:hypothetical protein
MTIPTKEILKIRQGKVKIGSWNIQGGINSQYEAETICKDMEKYHIGIGVLQETKCGDFSYQSTNGTHIIGMAAYPTIPKQRQHGQVFIISKSWVKYYWGSKRKYRRELASHN